jgi:uncharacterized membrane protein YphA (DoxX/SURF4 family)
MHDDAIRSPYWALRMTFGLVPIVAGLDKFFNLITYWPKYIAPQAADMLPVSGQSFMYAVGVIEIVAGLLVLSPLVRTGAYVVSAWLIAIAANLVMGGFYDIAVRDVAMSIAAFALGQLAAAYQPGAVTTRGRSARMEYAPSGA